MKSFLMMLLKDANVTSPTIFVEIVNSRKGKKINLHSANCEHIVGNIVKCSWLNQRVSELIDENAEDDTKHCRVYVTCPLSAEKWTIYYSDETTQKTH